MHVIVKLPNLIIHADPSDGNCVLHEDGANSRTAKSRCENVSTPTRSVTISGLLFHLPGLLVSLSYRRHLVYLY